MIDMVLLGIYLMKFAAIVIFGPNLFSSVIESGDIPTLCLVLFMLALFQTVSLKGLDIIKEQANKEQLEKLAYVDLLTGVYNRNFCFKYLDDLKAQNYNNYGIYLFDADNLKHANDNYGHEMGDKLIKTIGECLSEAFKGYTGLVGRCGGDEFIVVFRDIRDMDKFKIKFDYLVSEVNEHKEFPFEFSVSYGCSIGNEYQTVDEVRDSADKQMYEFKRRHKRGRDSITC